MKEIWKDIGGFEGFYQISNMGRIKSIAVRRSLWGKIYVIPREKMLVPWDNGNGYLMVSLRALNKRTTVSVHRLVAKAFIDNTGDLKVVNHKDHNTHNNKASNLEWCTSRQNVLYSSDRMHKPKSTPAKTSTGEKYITRRNGKYRVNMKQVNADKLFDTLEKAIAFRNEVIMQNAEYYRKGVV